MGLQATASITWFLKEQDNEYLIAKITFFELFSIGWDLPQTSAR